MHRQSDPICFSALRSAALAGILLCAGLSANAAPLPSEWQHEQQLNVPAAGLVKLSLPAETLDAARPGLEDLRLYDDAGNEIPFVIERPAPASKVTQTAKSFQVSLQPTATVITLETGLTQPLDGVTTGSLPFALRASCAVQNRSRRFCQAHKII